MTISKYLDNVSRLYKTGSSREHSYRIDLGNLLSSLLPDILVTNEPARVSCGAPDYMLTRKDVPVGYIEAKDIGVDLKSKSLKEQFDRYKAGLNNLIFTDYLDFHFYKEGVLTTSVQIAEINNGQLVQKPENFERFKALIQNFAQTITQTIKSPTKLAGMMAGKAKLMADVIEKALEADDEQQHQSALKAQMLSFKQMLIHDITNSAFADIYAQTIAYGMFAARYHDPTLPTFSRQEAATLIPKSNPFLRKLFHEVAGYDLDDRLVWIVDELVQIFLATDVADIMRNFGKSTKQEDPVVHFYETFLAAYNPALRKARGVWYTPQPVVNFMVRAVDDILKTEFGLKDGLADTSKTKVKLKVPTHDKRFAAGMREYVQEVHKVQILDPATGTGTFLAEVVRHIYKKFEGQQGIWSKYVSDHLIPRLNGFELLMASYAMAHLKMDMLLTETGYKSSGDQRFRIFLTNSLEDAHPDTRTLFSSWLSDEADQANAVKKDTPVMVMIGNPPYSGESANKGEWIMKLMEDYKQEPGGKGKLKERNPKWLNDDYVKFLRFGQHFIDKNGEGILAFINPHGFLDNPTFRGMRWNLLKSFDKIYTIDLHGNSKKKEVSPDGSPDLNVFDIMQGVSINLFVKTGRKMNEDLGQVFHFDLYGKREFKYDFLNKNSIETVQYKLLSSVFPNYFFVGKDFGLEEDYYKGFILNELFPKNNVGIVTSNDDILINFEKENLINSVEKFYNIESTAAKISPIHYRPFDKRYVYYDVKLLERAREKIMNNFLNKKNIGIVASKQCADYWKYIFLCDNIGAFNFTGTAGRYGSGSYFPLYLYLEDSNQTTTDDKPLRVPNLNTEIVNKIAEGASLNFQPEENPAGSTVAANQFHPIDLLDYIYAVLHSPSYREKYKEFLKIDFPRVPYPTDAKQFFDLVEIGSQLRKTHLLEAQNTEKYITQYPVDGNNVVEKVRFEPSVIARNEAIPNSAQIATPAAPQVRNDAHNSPSVKEGWPQVGVVGKVYINETQYFDNVPQSAWEFYIGGYQPAQKWLKDRKGRELSFEDILHYQKIIVALSETGRLMEEIEGVVKY